MTNKRKNKKHSLFIDPVGRITDETGKFVVEPIKNEYTILPSDHSGPKGTKIQNSRETRIENKFPYLDNVVGPIKDTLTKIAVKSNKHPEYGFNNLLPILYDPDFLIICYNSIRSKPGAMTPGVDGETIDGMKYSYILDLSNSIKNGTFRWNPIKRIYIDKTGNSPVDQKMLVELARQNKRTKEKVKELKIRPLGIPSTKDKIVQEGIRIILNAIYEPTFALNGSNFGFRPRIGTNDAIRYVEEKAKSMRFAIEADIAGAFNNVDHDIIIQIIGKRIKDPNFLKLIKESFKCGLIFTNKFENTLLGTTQGSNCSPILYNIYFHEFDKYIQTTFNKYIENLNETEGRKANAIPRRYQNNRNAIKRVDRPLKRALAILATRYTKLGKPSELDSKIEDAFKPTAAQFENAKIEFKKHNEIKKALISERNKLSSRSIKYGLIRFVYVRYADDWVLFTNAHFEKTKEFFNMFKAWISKTLKLELSETKTSITNLAIGDKVHFLGYQLSYVTTKQLLPIGATKRIRSIFNRTKRNPIQIASRRKNFKQRSTNPNLIVAWDRTRVLNKLEKSRFIRKKNGIYIGRSKSEWTTLNLHQIVEKYNYMIRGYVNFYSPCVTYLSDTAQIQYLLQYSCLHTIANKLNCTIGKVIKKFGKNITIDWKEEVYIRKEDKEIVKEKSIKILTWMECTEIAKKIRKMTIAKKKPKEINHDC